jgi:hypothetical protein
MDHNHHPPRANALDEIAFCTWLGEAAVGDIIEYYRGFLAADLRAENTALTRADQLRLESVARRAQSAADRGLVDLAQRRIGFFDYQYIAILRRRPLDRRRSCRNRKL